MAGQGQRLGERGERWEGAHWGHLAPWAPSCRENLSCSGGRALALLPTACWGTPGKNLQPGRGESMKDSLGQGASGPCLALDLMIPHALDALACPTFHT